MSSVTRILTWPVRQTIGFFVNVYRAIAGLSLDDLLPPWVRGTLAWLRAQVPRALGFGTPQQQITASLVIAVAMILASLGILTVAALVMIVPLLVGVARFVPAVEARWPLSRSDRP